MLVLQVKLTDYEHSVLLNLQDCVAANRSQGTPTLTTSQAHKDLDLQQSYMGEPHFEKDTGTSGPELEGPDADKGNARRQSSAWDMVHLLSSCLQRFGTTEVSVSRVIIHKLA